ncbi:hypothetical protein MTR67_014776 [Solanum verrucosum]|uniref:Zinc finger GRF-type domain-containing protein n=1 Tax=Solanum verrucosum TaxID=315347 RepID=A0AAF0QDT4_SOLVR|nr:hypothetical protein MTR67_014776 [Solanum verrucosum]
MKTSWTQSNPGRRFLCCKIHFAQGGCGYFRWYGDEMPAQARRVIWGLLKRVKHMNWRGIDQESMDDMHCRRDDIGYLDLCNKIILVGSFVFYYIPS